MRSFRSLIDPGGRSLAFHLDRLCLTLDALTARLRAALAEAVSQSAAGVARDTVQALLADPDLPTRPRYRDDYGPRRSPWDDFDDRYRDDADDRYGEARYDEDADVYGRPAPRRSLNAPESRPTRWPEALAAGLRAAAWWLQGQLGKRSCLVALGIGTGAAAAFLAGGRLSAAGLRLALAVLGLTGLQALLRDGVRGRSAFGTP
jgi:hypothetical protein